MKTLLFAPLFLDEGERLQRNIKWFDYYIPLRNKELNFDHIHMVDNASSQEKLDKFIQHIKPSCGKDFSVSINRRGKRLIRWSAHAYGFWYRAFAFGIKYAMENGYDKIVHIDTDVYVLNQKICDYVNKLDSGWTSMWCEMYKYPESTFQIIYKDQFELAHRWFTEDFLEFYPTDIAETRIPWTHVEKGFVGDRYGEKNLQQTDEMDWFGQTPVNTPMRFRK